MRTYNGAIIDCIGTSGLMEAADIARNLSVLDAEGEDIIFIDLSNDEVLEALKQAEIICDDEYCMIANQNIQQLTLIA